MNEVLIAALHDWRTLNEKLHAFREDQVNEMLQHERQHKKRVVVLERLHQRYNSLRITRERHELMKEANAI